MLHRPVPVSNYRESRDFACESKFLLSAEQAAAIREWARRHLEVDPHGTGVHGDHYQVASVYFDTPRFDVFQRTGSYGRSKYRIRRYNDGERVFLERKTKTQQQVSKRRTLIPLNELQYLRGTPDPHWLGYWFQRRLQLRDLHPVCCISYARTARLGMAENGPCRLTLDTGLVAAPCDQPGFDQRPTLQLLPEGRHIMELKYRYHLPVLFRRLLNEFAPLPQKISKYRLAIEGLGLGQTSPAAHREVV